MRTILIIALLASLAFPQSVVKGNTKVKGKFTGVSQLSGPLTYAARTDGAVFGTGVTGELLPAACSGVSACLANAYNSSAATGHQGAALSYTGSPTQDPPAAGVTVAGTNINSLNSYLVGVNSAAMPAIDPDFNTPLYRATDASFNSSVTCLGGGTFGASFNMGSGGSTRNWSQVDTHGWRKLLIQTTSGTKVMVHFNPANGQVIPTNLCGGYLPGATTNSATNATIIYTANNGATNQEQTLVGTITGTFSDQETIQQATSHATATLLAQNATFIQIGPVTGTADASHTWTGQTSGATLVPTTANIPATGAATPYANTIYQGVINDTDMSADYRRWSVAWSLVFNFNFVAQMAGDPHFPAASGNCLPAGYLANYTGVFEGSDQDSSFTIDFSDNGQANHTGYYHTPADSCANSPSGICQGPVYLANYRVGYGCRMLNTMTDVMVGDWGPQGAMLNGQANLIAIASATGTPTPDDIFIQDVTGAETQLNCMQVASGQCVSSGALFTGWTKAFTGLIYPGASALPADSTHVWRDCGVNGTSCGSTGASNYFTPSAAPTNAPFYYPDVMHDATSLDIPTYANFSMVQQPDMKVNWICSQSAGNDCQTYYNAHTSVCPGGWQSGITLSNGQTVVCYTNNATYSPGQVFTFQGTMTGANDGYLRCSSAAQCPTWTAVAAGDGEASGGMIVLTDSVGTGYQNSETPANLVLTPWGQGSYDRSGYVGGNFWQNQTLIINSNIGATGHSARGYNYNYQGKFYQAYIYSNPSTPATSDGTPNGTLYTPATNVAYAQTPPPGSNVPKLLPYSVTDDQHGTNWAHGVTDLAPVGLVTTLVCGQQSGAGNAACETAFASLWDSELVAVQNAVTQSSPGNLQGASCNYGSGSAPCVYRLGHTFNTNDNWNFNGQNAIGVMSPDGQWLAFPSDWNKTLGCMDLSTTNCWSSWQATTGNASGSGTAWSVDGSGNVTITMSNSFCPTGGTQAWSGGDTISCGTRAGTVTISGFSGASWLNGTFTLGANTANNWGCASGTCTKFIGTNAASGSHLNSSGTESGGTQKAVVPSCGNGTPCQREDIWIANIGAAHQ